jgi:hypothetical protein
MVKNATRWNATAVTGGVEQKGMDTSSIQTVLQNGDIPAVTVWLKSCFPAHTNEMEPRHTAWGHSNTTGLQGRP